MNRSRSRKSAAVIALCCTVAGAGLVGCEDPSKADSDASATATTTSTATSTPSGAFTGTEKITVDGRSVNVSCSGSQAGGRPVVVLLHGGGDDVTKLAGLQKSLSKKERVCSYDRLGAGASDKPEGQQTIESSGEVLTGVLEKVAGDAPVVLAGHSLGGLIAARYAPDHQDRVAGLVLMDATSPTQSADLKRAVPESATGDAATMRDQFLALAEGNNPEKLVIPDGKVRSAGDLPVQVIKHGQQYLAEVPEYGPDMERAWSEGQRKWLAVSSNSDLNTAEKSGHYIYVDQPNLAIQAIKRVSSQAADKA